MLLVDLYPTTTLYIILIDPKNNKPHEPPHNAPDIQHAVAHIAQSPLSPINIHANMIQIISHPNQLIPETSNLHPRSIYTFSPHLGQLVATQPQIFTLIEKVEDGDEDLILIRKGNLLVLLGTVWELVTVEFGCTRTYLYYAPIERHPLAVLNIKLEYNLQTHLTGHYKLYN
jgi:hypothetical protein